MLHADAAFILFRTYIYFSNISSLPDLPGRPVDLLCPTSHQERLSKYLNLLGGALSFGVHEFWASPPYNSDEYIIEL